MRVPDITLTAGNAAQPRHIVNKFSESDQQQIATPTATGESSSSLQLDQNEVNKNENWAVDQLNTATATGPFDFLPSTQFTNTSAYTSSADEFVQRALSSSLAVPCEYTNSTLAAQSFEEYFRRNLQRQSRLENFGSNSNSAYKGFQEVYVNRAAIALDDFEETNRSKKLSRCEADTKSGKQQYDNYNLRASIGVRPTDRHYDYNNDMKKDVSSTVYEENSNHQQQSKTNATAEEYVEDVNDPEKDQNDQPMLDLCNDRYHKSDVEQHNDELDEYLTSPTSSSVSLGTPQRSYFPRGIINPNYPGFQHLAHTLSEHFIGCTPSDSYDSDMSECEMELSADSCEELPSEEQQVEMNVKMNIYNNNSHKRSSSGSRDLPTTAQQIQQSNRIAYTDANSNNSTTNKVTSGDQQQLQQQQQHQQEQHNKLGTLIANELHDNLRQLLTLNVPDNYSDAYIINSSENFAFRYDQKCRLVAQMYGEGPQVHGTTPDILLKNCNLRPEQNSKKENRPDLLRGVSPQPLRKRVETADEANTINSNDAVNNQATASEEKIRVFKEEICNATTPVRSSEICKDDAVGFGITPVDIIGDFEQEVEREFGLLVSGYRRLVETNDEANEDENEIGEPQPIEKVSDALLSSAKDLIDSDKYINALQQTKEELSSRVETEAENGAKGEIQHISSMDYMEDNNAVDWSYGRGSDSEEIHSGQVKEAHDNKLDDITDVSTVSNTSSAQMRPKYHKASYDERQLPPVAIEYKRCQQSTRNIRKSSAQTHEKCEKATKAAGGSKIGRNHSKSGFTNRFFNSKRSNVGCGSRNGDKSAESNANRRREEAEMHQYQQLISNKELILSNSRYAKMSAWAQYLKNSVKNHGGKYVSTDLASPSALDLFDAYKIGGDFDMETLQKHLKMAKEIEKKVSTLRQIS